MTNGSPVRVSACVDCGCAVIGGFRCAACRQVDEAERARPLAPIPATSILARWIIAAEVLAAVALGAALLISECVGG